MRHGNKFRQLSRKTAHRKAMLANMAVSLILHKRIKTTVAKAKELRKYVEPLITKSKNDTTHSRRVVFSYLKQKEAITELFSTVTNKIADRPGGYTRIIKTGNRLGDNAETCIIELVDFNELYVKDDKKKATKARTRRGGKKTEEKTVDAVKDKEKKTKVTEDVVELNEQVKKDTVVDTIEIAEETTEENVEVTEIQETVVETEIESVEEVIEEAIAETGGEGRECWYC